MKEFNKALLFITAAMVLSFVFAFTSLMNYNGGGITGFVVSEDGTVEEMSKVIEDAKPSQEVEQDLERLGFSRVREDGLAYDKTKRVVVEKRDKEEAKATGLSAIQGMIVRDLPKKDPIFKKLEDLGFRKEADDFVQ